jgi:hypothetical protein
MNVAAKAADVIKKPIGQRAKGERPGALRAAVGAAAAGVVATALVYKLLRQ